MPTALFELPQKIDPPRKYWTREEYDTLPETISQKRMELVEGELLSKMGKKRANVNALILLQEWLIQVFGTRFVHPEAPIDVAAEDNPTNEPEPDLIVAIRDLRHFTVANPGPEDLLLVIEIGNTTLSFDLTVKAGLYARADIREYWVADVTGRRMIVHRDPFEGSYRSVQVYSEQESIVPLAAPSASLNVASVFAAQV